MVEYYIEDTNGTPQPICDCNDTRVLERYDAWLVRWTDDPVQGTGFSVEKQECFSIERHEPIQEKDRKDVSKKHVANIVYLHGGGMYFFDPSTKLEVLPITCTLTRREYDV